MDYFSYNSGGNDVPEGAFKISPSALSRFFSETPVWFREHVLKEGPSFTGNTNSTLGTIVHGLASMYHETGSYNCELAEAYLDTIFDPTIDKTYIRNQYPVMTECLINSVVDSLPEEGRSEPFLWHEIIPGYGVGGSLDMLLPTEVRDFKTTGAMSIPATIPRNYWFQQMAYVWLARKHGYDVDRFTLDYVTHNHVNRISPQTGKPMKDYPTKHGSLVHIVTSGDLEIIENTLTLVAESVKSFNENPRTRHLIAKDMRLKVAARFKR